MSEPASRSLMKFGIFFLAAFLIHKNWDKISNLSTTVSGMLEVKKKPGFDQPAPVPVSVAGEKIIEIRSTPPGADIYLDKKPVNRKTPTRLKLKGGTVVNVSLELPGYQGCSALVDMNSNGVNCELKK